MFRKSTETWALELSQWGTERSEESRRKKRRGAGRRGGSPELLVQQKMKPGTGVGEGTGDRWV